MLPIIKGLKGHKDERWKATAKNKITNPDTRIHENEGMID